MATAEPMRRQSMSASVRSSFLAISRRAARSGRRCLAGTGEWRSSPIDVPGDALHVRRGQIEGLVVGSPAKSDVGQCLLICGDLVRDLAVRRDAICRAKTVAG